MDTQVQSRSVGAERGGIGQVGARVVSALGAVGALAAVVVLGDSLGSSNSAELTRAVVENSSAFVLAASLAAYAAAALVVAAVRVGRAVGGDAGRVVTAAGAATGVLLAFYYGGFAGGALVATEMIAAPGPGVSEGMLVLVNAVEFARYGATLALLVAAATVLRHRRGLGISALLLALLAATPFTAWVAAILAPVWLGVVGAAVSPGRDGRG